MLVEQPAAFLKPLIGRPMLRGFDRGEAGEGRKSPSKKLTLPATAATSSPAGVSSDGAGEAKSKQLLAGASLHKAVPVADDQPRVLGKQVELRQRSVDAGQHRRELEQARFQLGQGNTSR